MSEIVEVEVMREPGAEDLPLPKYQSELAAGMDLHAACEEPVTLDPGAFKLVPTGIRLGLPPGFEAQVRPRSGMALKHGVTVLNTPGTIDADYRGPVGVILVNLGDSVFTVQRGTRIAQLIISRVQHGRLVEVEQLDETDRGEGGFGHTGLHSHEE
jgi:dUTP pyrophosphatase